MNVAVYGCIPAEHRHPSPNNILMSDLYLQTGEAGGITQQIGATYVPASTIEERTALVNPSGIGGQVSTCARAHRTCPFVVCAESVVAGARGKS